MQSGSPFLETYKLRNRTKVPRGLRKNHHRDTPMTAAMERDYPAGRRAADSVGKVEHGAPELQGERSGSAKVHIQRLITRRQLGQL